MPQTSGEMILEALQLADPDGLEMCEAIEENDRWHRAAELIDPRAEIRFIIEGGGSIGGMAGPFHGIEGYRAGWREWLKPWEELRVVVLESIEANDGRVLLLASLRGRLRAGGSEIVQEAASVLHVREEKITAWDHYLDQDQARRAAAGGSD